MVFLCKKHLQYSLDTFFKAHIKIQTVNNWLLNSGLLINKTYVTISQTYNLYWLACYSFALFLFLFIFIKLIANTIYVILNDRITPSQYPNIDYIVKERWNSSSLWYTFLWINNFNFARFFLSSVHSPTFIRHRSTAG